METGHHRPRRILLADNDQDTLDICAEHLRPLGYRVFVAPSYEKARQLLSETWLHLAILDLRLTDDADGRDQSGLLLARDEEFRATPMIILTKYPTWEVTREALSPSQEGKPLAVDFIDKREGLEAMAQAVDHAFETYVRINNDLIIHHDERFLLSWPALAQVAAPDLTALRLAADRAEEMEDLWRRLFYEMAEVYLARLLLRRERCAVLRVLAFPGGGHAQELIVTVGPREIVTQEAQRHDRFSPADAGQRGMRQVYFAETHSFAGVAYAPISGGLEDTELFTDYYRAISAGEVCQAVDDLFGVSLLPWHQRPRVQEDRSLNEVYREGLGFGQSKEDRRLLEESVENLCGQALSAGLPHVEATRYRLTFHLPDDGPLELPHPAVFVFPDDEQTEIGPPALCGINLGAVRCDRILVDGRSQQTWPLDFSQIGPSPVLDDYVSLEASILFDLVTVKDLATQQQLVETLLGPSSFGDLLESFDDLSTGLRKAVRVIGHLRQRAATIPGSNLEEYQLGLLFQGARRLLAFQEGRRYPRQRLAAGLKVLLSTGLVARWLEGPSTQIPPSLPKEAKTGLWVDEASRSVWVEGRQVSLSRKLYELLMLLYRRAGQVCDRATIAREVFKVEFFDPLIEETRINPLIGRLRKRVEPDPSRPRYIITHHGVGYVLYPRGRSENG
jgi:DNA-binding response OmpR family regulator